MSSSTSARQYVFYFHFTITVIIAIHRHFIMHATQSSFLFYLNFTVFFHFSLCQSLNKRVHNGNTIQCLFYSIEDKTNTCFSYYAPSSFLVCFIHVSYETLFFIEYKELHVYVNVYTS